MQKEQPHVCFAILAKQKATILPLWLRCVNEFTYPKQRISLYVRTNNNTDQTVEILEKWLDEYGHFYQSVHFDKTDVEQKVEQYGVHEWNAERFSVLGKIRQESMQYTLEINADFYFVMDVDNCVVPETLQELVSVNLPIVAPLIINANDKNNAYANFFAAIDKNGYYQTSDNYFKIHGREIKGLIEVPVVHCTYLVRADGIKHLTYDDRSKDFEFVIFSRSARKNGITQYIDNRQQYGWLVLDEDVATLEAKIYPSYANIFATIYKDNIWGKGSGPGSSPEATARYRLFLSKFLRDRNIKSVLDYGCGDWQFSKLIDWADIDYLGMDVVPEVIEKNQAKYSKANVRFECATSATVLPQVDLILCKDVLQHLPVASNQDLLRKFRQASKMMLITNDNGTHAECNKDVPIGGWSPIKLEAVPYSLNAFEELTYNVANAQHVKTVYLIYGNVE